MTISLEVLLTSPQGFGLATATPVQRAICRASTGMPLGRLADDPDVQQVFGGKDALLRLPKRAPHKFVYVAAIRCGKSLFSAAKAYRATQICDVAKLGPGEIPRISIVSVGRDQAHAIYDHLRGALLSSQLLRGSLVEEPKQDSLLVKHPSGRPVEIKVVAAARTGNTLVSRWSAGVIFDEAPRMLGQADSVISLEDALQSIRGRMLDGAQVDLIGSPWAPRGPVYELWATRHGTPGDDVLVVQAPGTLLNPSWWTPERCAEVEADDPGAHRTDVLAQFADAEDSLLSSVDVQKCTRKGSADLEFVPGQSYVAAIDPATRGNAWTLIVVTSNATGRYQVVCARQWQGTHNRPLSPTAVLAEVAEVCSRYSVDYAWSDQNSIDSLRELAPSGFSLAYAPLTAPLWQALTGQLRVLVSTHSLEIPTNPVLRADLLGISRTITARGYSIKLSSSSGDGRHSDYVSALVLALQYLPDPPSRHVLQPEMDKDEARTIARLSAGEDFMESARRRIGGYFG